MLDPASATLVVAGDLTGIDWTQLAERAPRRVGRGAAASAAAPCRRRGSHRARRVVLVDKPGAPQSELRIGHVGVARQTPDFHAISVLNAILGGTFGSRLNRVLREEKGYTYGIHSCVRHAPPGRARSSIRTAVETAVTVPADRGDPAHRARVPRVPTSTSDELSAARDYLVGVFPLRFETAAQVAGALGGLVALRSARRRARSLPAAGCRGHGARHP